MTMRTTVRLTLTAATAALALPLLAGCGGGSAPAAAPSSSAAAPSSAPAASPTPTTDPAADTRAVQDAGKTFVVTAFAFRTDQSYAEFKDKAEPLMTAKARKEFEAAGLEAATATFKKRFSGTARTRTTVSGAPKVSDLAADSARVSVRFTNRIEQRRDGRWKVVQTAPADTADLGLVRQDGRWLVDQL